MAWVLVTGEDMTFYQNSLQVLRPAGHEVVGAHDGATALQLLGDTVREMIVLLRRQMGRLEVTDFLAEVAPNDVLRLRHTYLLVDGEAGEQSLDLERYLDLLSVSVLDAPADAADADGWADLLEELERAARRLPSHTP